MTSRYVRFAHAYSRRAARVRPPALFVRPPRFCLAASFAFCSCAGAKSAAVPGFQPLRCTDCPGPISGAERIERFSGSFSAKTLRVHGLACPRARLAVWAGSAPRAPLMSAICGSPWSEVTRRQCAGCPCLLVGQIAASASLSQLPGPLHVARICMIKWHMAVTAVCVP